MKRYTTADESMGRCEENTDRDLSLQSVCHITDWSEEEFDQISELKVGDVVKFDDISVERTK